MIDANEKNAIVSASHVWRPSVSSVFLAFCLLLLVWQCVAWWYWWPMIRLGIENTCAFTDANTASFHRFEWLATYAPGILHIVAIISGIVMIAFTANNRRQKVVAVLFIVCGLIGIAIIGFTEIRILDDLG